MSVKFPVVLLCFVAFLGKIVKSPLCVILEVQSSCHCPEVLHLLHSNFLIIFLSYRLGVCVFVCVCVPQCLPVKQRACPLEVLLFSPVLLPPAARLPPPAGWPRLPHADLFNCLPVPGPTSERMCVFPLRRGGHVHICTLTS